MTQQDDAVQGEPPKKIIFVLPFLAFFTISAICFLLENPDWRTTTRYVFYFPSRTENKKAVFAETRYLKSESAATGADFNENTLLNAKITAFMSDLVLGPVNGRFAGIVPAGTKLGACFVQNGVLYVNLVGNGFFAQGVSFAGSQNFQNSVDLLKKNIFSNFSSIKKIKIFINNSKISDD